MVEGTAVSESKQSANKLEWTESVPIYSIEQHEPVDSMLFSEHTISLILLLMVGYIVIKRIIAI